MNFDIIAYNEWLAKQGIAHLGNNPQIFELYVLEVLNKTEETA
jgi:hypothetical protein